MRVNKSISISQSTANLMELEENKKKLQGNTSAICENAILEYLGYDPRADLVEQLEQQKKQIEKNIEHIKTDVQENDKQKREFLQSKEFIDDISVRVCKDQKTTQGCCNLIRNKHGMTFSTDELITESRNVHGDRFDPKPRKIIKPRGDTNS